jgi:plastocyanin
MTYIHVLECLDMNYFSNRNKILDIDLGVYITLTVVLSLLMVSMADSILITQEKEKKLGKAFAQEQDNVNATDLYKSGQMVLGNNVKHLIILIPNEGHHGPGEEDEARFIPQPFVPQNVVITPGTEVVWFNGDIGHEHNIVVTNAGTSGLQTGPTTTGTNGTQLFNSGEFSELGGSTPYTFSQVGEFNYADTIDYEEGFRMTGKITVIDQETMDLTSNAGNGTSDTVGTLMVPSEDSQAITQGLRTAGFDIDSTANFQDLRSAGSDDGGDQQTLLVWTTNGKETSEIISTLQQISQELPYG